jgi:hypothetical protein
VSSWRQEPSGVDGYSRLRYPHCSDGGRVRSILGYSEACATAPVVVKRRSRVSLLHIAEYLTDDEFEQTFRLPRGAFANILALIHPALLRDARQAARSSGGVVQPALRLAITLRMLAGASYLALFMLFRVAKQTIYDVFHSTIEFINRRLRMHTYI